MLEIDAEEGFISGEALIGKAKFVLCVPCATQHHVRCH